ncbi:hypothetical protein BD770DRAFT_395012 [Pilaira anomala]|nr:hypothetical protein BD770DRAFT_395012 [Pilaira anomala]
MGGMVVVADATTLVLALEALLIVLLLRVTERVAVVTTDRPEVVVVVPPVIVGTALGATVVGGATVTCTEVTALIAASEIGRTFGSAAAITPKSGAT